MNIFRKALLVFVAVSALADAQQDPVILQHGEGAPRASNCTIGQVYFREDSLPEQGFYVCSAKWILDVPKGEVVWRYSEDERGNGLPKRTSDTVMAIRYFPIGSALTDGVHTQRFTAEQTITLLAGSCQAGGRIYITWDPEARAMRLETSPAVTQHHVMITGADLTFGGATGYWPLSIAPLFRLACGTVADTWDTSPVIDYRSNLFRNSKHSSHLVKGNEP